MINHQDVGTGGPSSGLMKEAAVKVKTLAATALICFAADLVPESALGKKRKILARAIIGLCCPFAYGIQLTNMFCVKKARFSCGSLQAALTEIVGATLDQFNPELQARGPLQKRQVFADQLLLQVDRVGRNHEPFTVGKSPEEGWNQVSKTFAGTGAGFDQSDTVVIESFSDRKCHAQLFWTVFKSGQALTDLTARSKEVSNLLMFNCGVLCRFKNFNHPVDLIDLIVNYVEADSQGAKVPGYFEVWFGRLEVSARVVVNNDISRAAGLEYCRDCFVVPTGKDFQVDDNLLCISMADTEDFVAFGFKDFLAQLCLAYF